MLKGKLVTPLGVSRPLASEDEAFAHNMNTPNNAAKILDVERKGICAS
jgi:hypothetical protein